MKQIDYKGIIENRRDSAIAYIKAIIKWIILSTLTGTFCGLIGTAFHFGIDYVTDLRQEHEWLLFMLPVFGLIIVFLYKITKTEGQSTNDIICAARDGDPLSALLIPAIFFSTILTHLGGGSAGREGAALQLGGDIGHQVGRIIKLDESDMKIATLTGMAAFFSALFGTPLAATMFAIMVINIGVFYHMAFIPCFSASMIAYLIARKLGVSPVRFVVTMPQASATVMIRVAIVSALLAFVAFLFCTAIRLAESFFHKKLPNAYIRVAVGGVTIIVLTCLCGSKDYLGAGMDIISRIIYEGKVNPFAFLLKIIFTSITIGAGFKGGEVVPSFFIGTAFGCFVAPYLGLDPSVGAALGFIAVFCGVTNCPISSIFLSVEIFGSQGLLLFSLACGISYMLSGYSGLYSSQIIRYSKLRVKKIDINPNQNRI